MRNVHRRHDRVHSCVSPRDSTTSDVLRRLHLSVARPLLSMVATVPASRNEFVLMTGRTNTIVLAISRVGDESNRDNSTPIAARRCARAHVSADGTVLALNPATAQTPLSRARPLGCCLHGYGPATTPDSQVPFTDIRRYACELSFTVVCSDRCPRRSLSGICQCTSHG